MASFQALLEQDKERFLSLLSKNTSTVAIIKDVEAEFDRLLYSFNNESENDAVKDAANKNEPCCITRYVTDLAQLFNKFYNTCNIMKSEPALRDARLKLTEAACVCIKTALYLIGVRVVEKM